MNRRTLTTIVLLGLAVATALPQIAFAQTDPFFGTWQLNLAKSKYSPGPPPKSETWNVQAEGQNHKLTGTLVNAEGNPRTLVIMRVLDGQPHPAGNLNFDVASTRVDANTLIESHLRAAKLVGTETLVVSPDGKTVTATVIGLNADGQKFGDVRVYDKQ